MAKKVVAEIVIKGTDKASPALRKVKTSADYATEAFALLAKAAAAAGVAFAAMAVKSVLASNAQETSIRKLDAALKKVGSSYALAGAEINKFASAQQDSTRFGDDQTQRVLTQLIQLTGDYGSETLRAAAVIQDMAESGMSLDGATRAVGMALAGNVQALGRYVPALRGLAQSTLDAMTATERQELVLKALEGQYAGTASSIDPLDQRLANISNTLGDVSEAFGLAIKGSEDLDGATSELLQTLKDTESAIKRNDKEIAAIAGALIRTVVPAIESALNSLNEWEDTLRTLLRIHPLFSVSMVYYDVLFGKVGSSAKKAADEAGRFAIELRRVATTVIEKPPELEDDPLGLHLGVSGDRLNKLLAQGDIAAEKAFRASAKRRAAAKASAAAETSADPFQVTSGGIFSPDFQMDQTALEIIEPLTGALERREAATLAATAAQEKYNAAMKQYNDIGRLAVGVGDLLVKGAAAFGASAKQQEQVARIAAIGIATVQAALEFARGWQSIGKHDPIGAAAHFTSSAAFALVAGSKASGAGSGSSGRGRGAGTMDVGSPSPRLDSFSSSGGESGPTTTNVYNVQGALVTEQNVGGWVAGAVGTAEDTGQARADVPRNA